MIDLISTREGVDIQTQRCAHLVAAIIGQALQDLCTKPRADEAKAGKNLDYHAWRSVEFFVGSDEEPQPLVDAYARLIGLDGQAMREALLSDRPLLIARGAWFGDVERKRAQARMRWGAHGEAPQRSEQEVRNGEANSGTKGSGTPQTQTAHISGDVDVGDFDLSMATGPRGFAWPPRAVPTQDPENS